MVSLCVLFLPLFMEFAWWMEIQIRGTEIKKRNVFCNTTNGVQQSFTGPLNNLCEVILKLFRRQGWRLFFPIFPCRLRGNRPSCKYPLSEAWQHHYRGKSFE